MATRASIKIKIQLYCGDEIAMGPGKADLLDAIISAGSISGAARAMGLSYRRAWLLVDTMNRCWQLPLVATVAGGSSDHGAQVTTLGLTVLSTYRSLQIKAAAASRIDTQKLELALLPLPHPSKHNKPIKN